MRNTTFWWVLIGLMALIDVYFFQVLKVVSQSASPRTKTIIYSVYWILSIGAIILLIILPYISFDRQAKLGRTIIFFTITGLFFAKLVACLFFFIDDARRGIQWLASKINTTPITQKDVPEPQGISRSVFLSWAGMAVGGGLFGTLIYGFGNKYRYQINKTKLHFENLPTGFRGLRVVHISDIHSGSFTDKKAVMRGVDKIMRQKPDLILFTGDLVNNVAIEMEEYMDVFDKLKAPMGVFSILGNHDYGDYVNWDTEEEKLVNLEKLKQVHAALGWRLLMNEHVVLEKGADKIALLGVENWSSKARFPKYGDLKKAYEGTELYPFKILLSHDPSHWKGEVCESYKDIDLMLAGHTHGMQFGVELPGFKWSPVQYVYKEWAGLYTNNTQHLYINRGFGFIGYPGRVGILPEISVLEFV